MGNGIGGRIVGGQDADEGEYPWQVSWRRVEGDGAYHSCGGSVLNEDFVLTAGPQSKYNREFLSPISNVFSFLNSKGGMGKFSSILLKYPTSEARKNKVEELKLQTTNLVGLFGLPAGCWIP